MLIINDPLKAIKNQALKIWATKEFAERELAFSRTTWFLHAMYCFVIIVTIDTFIIIAVNDMFTLIHFYEREQFWLLNLVEDIYTGIHPLVEVAILYFWLSPIIIRTTLLISKAYSNKEKAVFEWIEFKIKRRFPNYKTSSQKARERLEKPKKKGKLNMRFDKYLEKRNDVERIIIRAFLWFVYLGFLGTVFLVMFAFLFDEDKFREKLEEAETVIEEAETRDQRPTGLPPKTIYDIFINKPITVIP